MSWRLVRKGARVAPARPQIFLHIGAMKTGTTFLQQLMVANKDHLAEAGFLFPGARWNEQDRAVRDVLGITRRDPPMRALCEGMWDKVASEMLSFDGQASIFSMEFLSFANRKQAARVVSSLDDAEVHVVLTVRDAAGALPAQWQTHSRNGGTLSWPAFAGGVRRGSRFGRLGGLAGGKGAHVFQMGQGVPRMLSAWGAAVPSERLHVVTVPPSGSDPALLWERFATAIGVDPTVCSVAAGTRNSSLGQPSADLIRRINARLGRLPPSEYQPTLKAQLATRILAGRSSIEAGPTLDMATRTFAVAWNRRVRAAIERSGAHVVGDLVDLPVEPPAPSAHSDTDTQWGTLRDPEPEEVLAAAVTARDGLTALIGKRTKRLSRLGGVADQNARAGREIADLLRPSDPWRDASDPVDAAVTELTSLVRVAIDLQHRVISAKKDAP